MTMMTVERLHDLLDKNPTKTVLSWEGACHDCQKDLRVTATCMPDGIQIEGGSVYEPEKDRFLLKCDDCFKKDSVLKNFQECEVYSRVVGYLRPVGQWNDAKFAEFNDRQTFDSGLA